MLNFSPGAGDGQTTNLMARFLDKKCPPSLYVERLVGNGKATELN